MFTFECLQVYLYVVYTIYARQIIIFVMNLSFIYIARGAVRMARMLIRWTQRGPRARAPHFRCVCASRCVCVCEFAQNLTTFLCDTHTKYAAKFRAEWRSCGDLW